MLEKALVTGSTGFIGSHLVDALLKEEAEVHVLLRRESKEGYLREPIERGVVIPHRIDNYLDIPSSVKENVNCVFHLAGVTKGVTEEEFYEGNVVPTRDLLESLEGIELDRFVYFSSIDANAPSGYYGESKREAEKIIESESIPFTIIRPGGVYGPRDKDYSTLFKLKGLFFSSRNMNRPHPLIYVDDLMDGTLKAAFSENAVGKSYDLCNDEPVSLKELSDVIAMQLGKKSSNIPLPEFVVHLAGIMGDMYSHLSGRSSLINTQKISLLKSDFKYSNIPAKRDLGFEPKISLEEGVRRTLEGYDS